MKNLRIITVIVWSIVLNNAAYAQDPSQVPDGDPSRISDWALAGIIWSDASLAAKLTKEAAKNAESPEQIARFNRLSQQSSETLQAMEAFGWKQVRAGVGNSNKINNTNNASNTSDTSEGLPDPEQVGAALAESMGLNNNDAESTDRSDVATRPTRAERMPNQKPAEPVLDRSIKRFDTETPLGRDDPGLDDERTGEGVTLDVDHYRVDDYIDETPNEARNRADAIEDGVEGAIAAAAGRLGMGTRTAGRISYRETQTRSATMPYSRDSIYDADDYDPDVDYDVDNPLGMYATNPQSVNRGDRDDDINRQNPAKVVDGEDEMIAAMARQAKVGSASGVSSPRSPASVTARSSRTNLDRYTSKRSQHAQDANWVQFHLDANQAVWQRFTTQENLMLRANDAVLKLRANISVAMDATDNQQLQNMLRQFQ